MPKRKKRTLPSVGEIFEGRVAGITYKMEVVKVNGKICYKVNGKIYGSPSGAAKSLTRHEVNGWRFWRI